MMLQLTITLMLSIMLMPLLIMIGRRHLTNRPTDKRWSTDPISLTGGLIFGLVIMQWLFTDPWLAACAMTMLLLGLLDDLEGTSPKAKLIFQIAIAGLYAACSESRFTTLYMPLDYLVTVFWIVGITNAFNLVDNMDASCGVISVIVCIGLIGFGIPVWALMGCLLGFLYYNWKPASVYLGDSGALFLGFVFGALSLQTALPSTAVLLCGVPIADVCFVSWRRVRKGQSIAAGGSDHLGHVLARRIGETRAALMLGFVQAVLVCIAIGQGG